MSDHKGLMDGVYRYQRHIYDLTRKYYLLGRDGLIADLAAVELPASVGPATLDGLLAARGVVEIVERDEDEATLAAARAEIGPFARRGRESPQAATGLYRATARLLPESRRGLPGPDGQGWGWKARMRPPRTA